MRAAIYGAGSLGTILGAYITKKGGKIDLINRNVKHVEALQKNGAKVTGTVLFSAMGHPFQQLAEMMSRSSVTSGCSLVWRRTDFRLLS